MALTCLFSCIFCGLGWFPGFLFCMSLTVWRHSVGCPWLGFGLVYLDRWRRGLREDKAEGTPCFPSFQISIWTSSHKAVLATLPLYQVGKVALARPPIAKVVWFPFFKLCCLQRSLRFYRYFSRYFYCVKRQKIYHLTNFKSMVLWMCYALRDDSQTTDAPV